MTYLSNMVRHEGDPKVIRSGPSSMGTPDRLAKALGWFSLALGVTQLVAPEALTRRLGMEGSETLMRACGAREIAAGMLSLSTEKQLGLWSRVGGDAVDIGLLTSALRDDNPQRENVALALAAVFGISVLDVIAAQGTRIRHARGGNVRMYRDRSGFPKGLEAARGAARDVKPPPGIRAAPALAHPASRRPSAA